MDRTYEELRDQIVSLGPWAYDLQITPELSTRVSLETPPDNYPPEIGHVNFSDPSGPFLGMMRDIFPDGLAGRSVMDCACNGGIYLFCAKTLGAGRCFGFDVREHWIRQARFVAENRTTSPTDDMTFQVCDLYDVPKLGLEPFDVTFFHGIFYHLPDPVTGLKVAGDHTKELLVLNTTTIRGYPEGVLVADEESRTWVRSGVYGLNWFPSGPEVLSHILNWMGFTETRCDRWRQRSGQRAARREELRMLAARDPETLRRYDEALAPGKRPVRDAAQLAPSGATVLVASGGDERLLELGSRRAWHFPAKPEGGWGGEPAHGQQLVANLRRLREEGAQYLLMPAAARSWRERFPQLGEYLDAHARVVSDEHDCVLYELLGNSSS
jgi:tRNA (mo5U34)-methyltransferase